MSTLLVTMRVARSAMTSSLWPSVVLDLFYHENAISQAPTVT
jgi:hypothetical protein